MERATMTCDCSAIDSQRTASDLHSLKDAAQKLLSIVLPAVLPLLVTM